MTSTFILKNKVINFRSWGSKNKRKDKTNLIDIETTKRISRGLNKRSKTTYQIDIRESRVTVKISNNKI